MSTLHTVQTAVITPPLTLTPPVAEKSDSLPSIVQNAAQSNVPIKRAAQGAPAPMPAVQPQVLDTVQNANAGSAKIVRLVAAVMTGKAEAEGPVPVKGAVNAATTTPPLDATLQHVVNAYIELAENPLPIEKRTVTEVQGRLDAVQQLQDLLNKVPDAEDAAFLHANLALMEEHLQDDMQSVQLKDIVSGEWLTSSKDKTAEQRLSELTGEWPYMLEILQERVESSAKLLSPDIDVREEARQKLEDMGTPFFAPELAALQSAVHKAVAQALEHFAADPSISAAFLQNIRPEHLAHLSQMVLRSSDGIKDVLTLLHALGSAHEAYAVTMPPTQAAERLGELVNSMLHASDPSERLACIDDIFRYGYPDTGDLALQIKHLMVGEEVSPLGVEAQHALELSLHDMLSGPRAKSAKDGLQQTADTPPPRQLTLEMVKNITKKGTGTINYQLAHMVLLQSTAAAFGCLAAAPLAPEQAKESEEQGLQPTAFRPAPSLPKQLTSADMANTLSGEEAATWCKALGMDHGTATYTALGVSALQQSPQDFRMVDHLLQASMYYQKGIAGSDAADKAAHTLLKVGSMTTHRHSQRHALALYSSNAAVHARLALDRYLVGLSGLNAETRLVNADEGLAFKEKDVNDAITKRLTEGISKAKGRADAVRKALAGSTEEGDSALLTDRHSDLVKNMRGHRHAFVAHYKLAQELFHVTEQSSEKNAQPEQSALLKHGALLEARGNRAEVKAERAKNKALRGLMGHNWAHLKPQRKEACALVLEIDKLRHETVDSASDATRQAHETKMQELLQKLGKFNPYTFTRVKNGQALAEKDLEEVLEVMLPRAKALEYFAKNGVIHYQKQRRESLYALNTLRMQEFTFKQKMREAYGTDTYHLVRGAVEAAALGVFLEQRCTPSEFSLINTPNVLKIMEKLEAWGLKAEGAADVLTPLVYRALHKVTLGNGTLNFAKLRKNGESLSRDLLSTPLRAEGKSRLAAHKLAKTEVLHSADAAIRKEGIRGLMENMALPGSAMIIDRSRGVMVDTGALFTPAGEIPVAMRSVRFPLSVQLQLMHSNSLGIVKTVEGYQVLIKNKTMASAAFNASLALGGAFKLTLGAGVSGEILEGLALDFINLGDCERFLLDFMDPESTLHKADTALHSLNAADQIRFVSGHGGAVHSSVGISASLLAIPLGEKHMVSASVSAAASTKHNYTHEVQQNALGQTVTMSNTTVLSASAGVSGGVINTEQHLFTSAAPLSVNRSVVYDVTERYKVDSGPRGVSTQTCLEREYGATALPHLLFLKGLPKAVQENIHANTKLMDKLYRVGKNVTPGMSVTLHCPLRGRVHEQINALLRKARAGNDGIAKQALKDAHALLANENSYAPTRLIVKKPRMEKLGEDYSPGLPTLKVMRRDTLLRMSTEIIPLT